MKKWNWRKGLLGAGAVLMALATSLQGAPAFADEGRNVVLPEGGITWEEGMTVYYRDETPKSEGDDKGYTGQYPTMADALTAVYMSDPGDKTAVLYCNPGSDVGELTHGHVADNLTIYGNGAYISGGHRDFEIDYSEFDRTTGKHVKDNSSDLTKDVTLTVKSLDGCAFWGTRNTNHKVTAVFDDCQNMYEIYYTRRAEQAVTDPIGAMDLTVTNCSFDVEKNGRKGVVIYLEFGGNIRIENSTFKGIDLPLSIRNFTSTPQTTLIKNCDLIDCATENPDEGWTLFLLGKPGAKSDFTLDGLDFIYTDPQKPGPKYPIKVGLGVEAFDSEIDFQMSNTEAGVVVHPFGLGDPVYFDVKQSDAISGSNNLDKKPIIVTCTHPVQGVKAVAKVEPTCTAGGVEAYWTCDACGKMYSDAELKTEIDEPVAIKATGHKAELVGAKDATCAAEGYTGDEVCSACKETLKKGEATTKLEHASEKWVTNPTHHWKACDACGAEFAVGAHEYGEWKVTEQATAEKAGLKERACSVCGYVDEAELPKLDGPAKPGQKPEAKPEGEGDGLPQTGDASALIQLAVAASGSAAIAAGAIAARKRR